MFLSKFFIPMITSSLTFAIYFGSEKSLSHTRFSQLNHAVDTSQFAYVPFFRGLKSWFISWNRDWSCFCWMFNFIFMFQEKTSKNISWFWIFPKWFKFTVQLFWDKPFWWRWGSQKNIGYKDEDTDFSQRGVSRIDDSVFFSWSINSG
jgi:hypothetical protein